MDPVNTRKLGNVLTSKGFKEKQGDHTFYFLYAGDKKTSVHTKISHGRKEYGANLLSQMSKDLHLTNKQFGQLIECPLSHEDYIQVLVDHGHLKRLPEPLV